MQRDTPDMGLVGFIFLVRGLYIVFSCKVTLKRMPFYDTPAVLLGSGMTMLGLSLIGIGLSELPVCQVAGAVCVIPSFFFTWITGFVLGAIASFSDSDTRNHNRERKTKLKANRKRKNDELVDPAANYPDVEALWGPEGPRYPL